MKGKIATQFNGECLPGAFGIGPGQRGYRAIENKNSGQANYKFSNRDHNGFPFFNKYRYFKSTRPDSIVGEPSFVVKYKEIGGILTLFNNIVN
jgi:hypothetical protein